MNYSELLQLAKGWSNFKFYRGIIWRLLCLPDFVTKVDFDWAIEEKAKKKKQDFTKIKFFTYDKGECV